MFPFIDLKITRIPLYGLCIAFGILVASLIAYFVTKKKSIAFPYFIIVETCCYAFGFLGAKILFVVVSFPRSEWLSIFTSFLSLQNKSNALMTTGFVFYGGLIFGIAGYFVGCKIAKHRADDFLGIFAFSVPLVHAFGRIGCFCAGCCWGIRYDGPFAVSFDHPFSSAPVGVPLFPVQLLECAFLFLLSFVLFALYSSAGFSNKRGIECALLYVPAYSATRFFTEYLRGDTERGMVFALSVSQFISIVLLVLSVAQVLVFFGFSKTSKTSSEILEAIK